ncbi:unnamed protein product, partial [Rotaria magnacalcarata]
NLDQIMTYNAEVKLSFIAKIVQVIFLMKLGMHQTQTQTQTVWEFGFGEMSLSLGLGLV